MRRALLLVLAIVLAGCSGGGGAGGDPSGGGDPTGGTQADDDTGPAPPTPMPPVELLNTTLDFAAASGGSAEEDSATLPAGYGNVTVTWTILRDCPAGHAAGPPAVLLESGGQTLVVWAYDMLVEQGEPYSCSPASQLQGRVFGSGEATYAAAGDVTVRTAGQFTAELEVVLTATQ